MPAPTSLMSLTSPYDGVLKCWSGGDAANIVVVRLDARKGSSTWQSLWSGGAQKVRVLVPLRHTYTDTGTDENVVITRIAPSSHSELNCGWRLCSSCSLRHRKGRKAAQALHDTLRISHDIFRHQLTTGRCFIDRVGAVWRQWRSDNSCTRHFERLFAHAKW